MRLAFVVQRYGNEVNGGAELHARYVAEGLSSHAEIRVLTTCARDYISWQNEYPEGTDRIRGVTVRRFACSRKRNIKEFNAYSDWIFENRHSPQDELEWLKQQGPWSPGLIDYLERHGLTFGLVPPL